MNDNIYTYRERDNLHFTHVPAPQSLASSASDSSMSRSSSDFLDAAAAAFLPVPAGFSAAFFPAALLLPTEAPDERFLATTESSPLLSFCFLADFFYGGRSVLFTPSIMK